MYAIMKGRHLADIPPFKSWEKAESVASRLGGGKRSVVNLWEACTNKASHGGRPSLRPQIHRYLRRHGVVFYLALFGEGPTWNSHGQWGMGIVSELAEKKLKDAECVITGYTLNHAFHKLGAGCAERGAKIYWQW